jgi:hypothetical protein
MALPTLRISSPSAAGYDTRVWLDGHEITHGLTGVTLNLPTDGSDVNRAELRFAVDAVEVDAGTLAALQAHVRGRAEVDLVGFGEVPA